MDGTGLQLALPGPCLLAQWPWTKERGKETKETPSSSLSRKYIVGGSTLKRLKATLHLGQL